MGFVEGKELLKFTAAGRDGEIVFRFPRTGDAAQLMNYINELIEENTFLAMTEKFDLKQEEKWLKSVIEKCRAGNTLFVVVESEGEIRGSTQVERGLFSSKHVGDFAITLSRELRGAGVGTRLMKFAVDYAKSDMGIEIFKFDYFKENDAARRLYEKLGFRQVGTIPKYFKKKGKYHDAVLMYKEL